MELNPEQQAYIQRHAVANMMDEFLQGLLEEMPSNPQGWLVSRLQRAADDPASTPRHSVRKMPARSGRKMSLARPNHFQPGISDILQAPHFNKGTAFSREDRESFGLEGLLPYKVDTLDSQTKRALWQLHAKATNLEKYTYLTTLKETNETIFYNLVLQNLEECLPLIYTPTVGEACLKFDRIFGVPQGMYISPMHRGKMQRVLQNWKSDDVDIIVVTDGSRILGLGDLGTNGMGIPIGKLALYVVAAGFHPMRALPIQLDCGTNNAELLSSEHYLGTKMGRMADKDYYGFVDEFIQAVKSQWPNALLQFEDFSTDHCFTLLERYRNQLLCFNDDVQGTGAVIAAGVLNAARASSVPLTQHTMVFVGGGSATIGVAEQICRCMVSLGMTEAAAMDRFYVVDSGGLVTATRKSLEAHKVPYARIGLLREYATLLEVVEAFQPTAIFGLTGQPNVFTEQVVRTMARLNQRPIVFALSNPTSRAECTAADAYAWTDGRCIFASGSPFAPVTLGGRVFRPAQGNNMYIFPGLGFGAFLGKCSTITDEMITEATLALADCVSENMLRQGAIYPPLSSIRAISAQVAARVMEQARRQGVSGLASWPADALGFVEASMWNPKYYDYTP